MRNHDDKEFARLLDWAEGRLSGEEAVAVEELLAADAEARATADWLRGFVRLGEDVVLASPPRELREALTERFEAYAEGRRGPGFFERLTASLSFEGGLGPAFGVRSAGTRESRQLVYSSEAADVALNLRPHVGEDTIDVDGQVLPLDDADPASFVVRLLDGGTEVAATHTDELGEFSFEALAPGAHELVVGGERVEIRIPDVELRP